MHADYYVYIYFRLDGTPCYVGKGRGRRWKIHLNGAHNPRLAKIIERSGGELPIAIIRDELTDADAKATEVALIAAIGRGKNGPLVNFTDGGEGTIGWKQPDHVREAVSRAQTGRNPTAETRMKMAQSQVGRKHPDEVKAKISRSHQGKIISEDHRQRMREGRKGMKLTPEHRAAIGAAIKGRVVSEETRAKMSAAWDRRRAIALGDSQGF